MIIDHEQWAIGDSQWGALLRMRTIWGWSPIWPSPSPGSPRWSPLTWMPLPRDNVDWLQFASLIDLLAHDEDFKLRRMISVQGGQWTLGDRILHLWWIPRIQLMLLPPISWSISDTIWAKILKPCLFSNLPWNMGVSQKIRHHLILNHCNFFLQMWPFHSLSVNRGSWLNI